MAMEARLNIGYELSNGKWKWNLFVFDFLYWSWSTKVCPWLFAASTTFEFFFQQTAETKSLLLLLGPTGGDDAAALSATPSVDNAIIGLSTERWAQSKESSGSATIL